MKPLFRQLLLLAVGLAALQLALIAGTYLLYSPLRVLDTSESEKTIYRQAHRLVAFGVREPALREEQNLVILGSSNSEQAFRPAEVRAELPEYRIHNLALNGTNISEIRLEVRLLNEAMPRAIAQSAVYVLGICYPVFADNPERNRAQFFIHPEERNTDYDAGLRRELARWSPDVLVTKQSGIVGGALNSVLAMALRPYFVLDNAKVAIEAIDVRKLHLAAGALLSGQWSETMLRVEPPPRFFTVPRADQLKYFQGVVGTDNGMLKEAQFRELIALAREVDSFGAQLILIDMPLPDWHRSASAYDADYRRRLPKYLPELTALPHVHYIDLHDAPMPFIDATHPPPNETKIWGRELANRIRPILANSQK